MKKQILTIVLGITTLTAFAQIPSYVPTSGLLGYWPFNGNAQDESGNLNHGTVNGATLTTDRNGVANKAYSFDGLNDWIKVNYASNLNLGNEFTLSVWINSNTGFGSGNVVNSDNHIISRWGAGGVNKASYVMSINSTGKISILNHNGTQNSGGQTAHLNSTGQWYLITVIFKNSVIKYYFNGILFDSISNVLAPQNSMFGLTFGREENSYPAQAQAYVKGTLDDIGIWNRALTPQEITALYIGCTTPTATITPQSPTNICQGGSVILNASTGVGYTYEWYKDGNLLSGSIASSYTAFQSGSYTVKVINGTCNSTSSATTVTVNPNPTVSLSLANFIHIKSSPVTLVGSPLGGTYSGAGVVGNTFSSTNAGLGKKTITYNYTSGAGCSGSATAITTVYDTTACSTFDTLFIKIAVAGLTAPNNLGTLKIWPNPANDHITIDNGNFSILNGYSVKIETVLGQEVFKSAINQKQFSIDLSTWKGKGIYLVHVLDGQSNIIETKKIILQ